MVGASRAGEGAGMVWCLKAFQRQLAALMFCATLVNAGLESAHCINVVFSSVSVHFDIDELQLREQRWWTNYQCSIAGADFGQNYNCVCL